MKNFYLWIVAAMVCIGILPAAAQDAEVSDITFKVTVNNAENVTCRKNYSDEIKLQDGVNELSFPNGTNLSFEAKSPYRINSVVNKVGSTPSGFSSGYWYLYVNPEVADEEYTMSVVDINDLRTAQFTLNVDDPSLVYVTLPAYNTRLDLKEGTNIIKFDPKGETTLSISPNNYSVPLYSVKKNNVEIEPFYGSYSISLDEDCVVDVVAKLPEGDATVDFSYSEGAQGSFKLSVNGESITDFNGKSLVVKIGDKLTFDCDRNTYNFKDILANEKSIYSNWGTIDLVVVKDTKIYVDAKPWGSLLATLEINNPEFITITNNGQTLELKEGVNQLELQEKNPTISWTVNPIAVINSVTVNGVQLESYKTYYDVEANDVIVFDVVEKVFDKKFIVWADNVDSPACANSIMIESQNDHSFKFGNQVVNYNPALSTHDIDNGYNLAKFYQALNPFSISWAYDYFAAEIPEYKGQVYLNDERLISDYGEYTMFQAEINDGDVLKFFFDAAPVECNVAFDIAEGVEVSVVKDVITAVEKPAAGFTCFNGTQVVVSGKDIEVKVNGTSVAADAVEEGAEAGEPSYTFVVADSATTVSVTKAGGSGVAGVAAEAESAVFNMQGVKVGNSLKGLAPGIYVVAGKKVVVTE